jgi:predicted DNA-binding transcriptional regulator YafY
MSDGFIPDMVSWKREWQGMPEFTQEKITAYTEITVRFETKEDLDDFAKVIGQNLTINTQAIWHPKLQKGKHQVKRYFDSEEE